MIEFFCFSGNPLARGVVEIQTGDKRGYAFVRPFLLSVSKEKLPPQEVSFNIAHGKRRTDIIVYHEDNSLTFYSQN